MARGMFATRARGRWNSAPAEARNAGPLGGGQHVTVLAMSRREDLQRPARRYRLEHDPVTLHDETLLRGGWPRTSLRRACAHSSVRRALASHQREESTAIAM